MNGLIGVTGATGGLGGRVAPQVASPRLIVRDASRAPSIPGAEVRAVPGGYAAFDGMRAALEGVETLLLVPAAEAADRLDQHRTAVDAAVAAGVRHIVYVSFIGESTFTFGRDHRATEAHIRAAGVAFTFPRMNFYIDVIPSFVMPDGVLRGPAGDGQLSAVLRDDVADVTAAILFSVSDHAGAVYDVTGREATSMAEAAALMSAVTGKPIRYEAETLEQARASRAHYGAPAWEVEGWVTSYAAIATGELSHITDVVARFTGHQPATLADYLAAHPEALDHVTR